MKRLFLSIVFILALTTSFVFADAPIIQLAKDVAKGSPVVATTTYRYFSETDVDATTGDIEISEYTFDLKYSMKFKDVLPFDFLVNAGHIDIIENVDVDLPARLEKREIGFSTKLPLGMIGDEYFVGIDAFVTSNTEDGDFQSGSLRFPFRTYLIKRYSEDFIVVGGVMIRPEYDEEVVPFIGFRYKPNDQWLYNFVSNNPTIEYAHSDQITLFAEGYFGSDEYEVERNGQPDVVLKYQSASAGGGVKYMFANGMIGRFSVGSTLSSELEYSDGVGKVRPESTWYTSVKFSTNF